MPEFNDNLARELSAYLDGELPEGRRSAVEDWLVRSPVARELLADLQRVRNEMRGLPRLKLRRSFVGELQREIDERHEAAKHVTLFERAWPHVSRWGSYAAVLAACVVTGSFVFAPPATVGTGGGGGATRTELRDGWYGERVQRELAVGGEALVDAGAVVAEGDAGGEIEPDVSPLVLAPAEERRGDGAGEFSGLGTADDVVAAEELRRRAALAMWAFAQRTAADATNWVRFQAESHGADRAQIVLSPRSAGEYAALLSVARELDVGGAGFLRRGSDGACRRVTLASATDVAEALDRFGAVAGARMRVNLSFAALERVEQARAARVYGAQLVQLQNELAEKDQLLAAQQDAEADGSSAAFATRPLTTQRGTPEADVEPEGGRSVPPSVGPPTAPLANVPRSLVAEPSGGVLDPTGWQGSAAMGRGELAEALREHEILTPIEDSAQDVAEAEDEPAAWAVEVKGWSDWLEARFSRMAALSAFALAPARDYDAEAWRGAVGDVMPATDKLKLEIIVLEPGP